MTWFARKPKLVNSWIPEPVGDGWFEAAIPQNVADAIQALLLEAEQTTRATTAMHSAHQRETQRQHRRIHALTEDREALRQAAVNAERAADDAREALDAKQDVLDRVIADYKKLDGELVKTSLDLGRERDDHRAFKTRWARHLNSCPVADAIDQEDAAKARTR